MRNKKERIFVKQNGLLCALKGRGRPHVTPHTQEAALMRLNVASLRRMVKGKLHVQFVRQDLTSYSGLELLRRYLRQLDLPRRLRAACAAPADDRCRWHRGPYGRHRGLGLSRLQSPSPERSQLLPPAGPRGPDGSHPASEESARQRA